MNEPSLTVERVIPGPIDQVFDAWLDPASLKQWMRPGTASLDTAETDPVVGGNFSFVFKNGPNTIPHEGEYREIDRPHRLVFTWKSEPAGDTLVTIVFTRVAQRQTKITLTHERFKTEAARDSHVNGWGGIFDKLQQTMEVQ
ncbi:MAG: SRPBCC domain-containing protein [Vicinamibacterales bacterium]|nr:SRPBCC domain-containing protein [Vicinamibacterales bacterium]